MPRERFCCCRCRYNELYRQAQATDKKFTSRYNPDGTIAVLHDGVEVSQLLYLTKLCETVRSRWQQEEDARVVAEARTTEVLGSKVAGA